MMKKVEGGHRVVGNDEEGILGFGVISEKEEAFCKKFPPSFLSFC